MFSDTKMNYSSSVKGRLTRSSTISYILSQAELELTRPLKKEEEAKLFERFAVQDIFNRIHKVGLILSKFSSYIAFCSMVMAPSSS